MRIYKLRVDSPHCDDNVFEDYYVSKDKAIDAGLDWISKMGRKDLKDISINEYSFGDVGFYTSKGTPLYWIVVEAIDTKD